MNRRWLFVFLAFALSLGSFVAVLHAYQRLLPKRLSELGAIERRVSALERRLSQLAERQALGERIREEIRHANPRLDEAAVREYGRLLLETTEKYRSVDPFFLLAVGVVESRFDARATSHANAKGLYQIWPATGRWLADEVGWEYSDEMLYQPAVSTELAACYLHKLFETYGDPHLVLAEYNGGPKNARRLRVGSPQLASETRDYVTKVMTVLDGIHDRRRAAPASGEPVLVASLD